MTEDPTNLSRKTPTTSRLGLVFIVIAALLFAGHVCARLIYRTKHMLGHDLGMLLDMSEETSLSTWFSVSLMLCVGIVCAALRRAQGRRGWYGPAALFTFLSMDDAAMIHERFGNLISPQFNPTIYNWVLILGPIFVILGLLVLVFLWRIVRSSRWHRFLLIAGFGCMGIALGLEVVEGLLVATGEQWRGIRIDRYFVPIEEWFELMGPILLLMCVGSLLELELTSATEA